MSLEELLRDSVRIEKTGGEVLGPVKALVTKGKIKALAGHPIEPGDVLIREMPHGNDERYVVDEPGYMQGVDKDIPPHFQAEVHRENAAPKAPAAPAHTTNNFYGANARINQNSSDHSINITIESADGVFNDLRSELRASIADSQKQQELLQLVDEMQESKDDQEKMSGKLGQFISKGADVMTIISPFIPLLASIATGGGA